MDYALEVHKLSKCFFLFPLRRTLFKLFKKTVTGSMKYKEIWALHDINFALRKGEHIGFIGDNGAGKTTLLRIIAGIYRHTTGTVKVNGKIAGFFQFELGMDRDLTVLDNIFLFGAIMGLSKKEINKRLGNIIDFSELKDFMYFPLRDISTGAVQRLAIAIAKESHPEIMFLDEMLSGADFGFQAKCLEVFSEYKKNGSSLIMTSHDLGLIERVCDKVLLLDKGKQLAFGPAKEIVAMYRKY